MKFHRSFFVLLLAPGLACNPASPDETSLGIAPSSTGLDASAAVFSRSAPPAQSFFFPLQAGNKWTYSRTFSVDGDILATGRNEHELTGYENISGHDYMLDEILFTETFDGQTDQTMWWVRYRQDRAGLYEADVPLTDPPASVVRSDVSQHRVRGKTKDTSFRERAIRNIDWSGKSPAYRRALLRNIDLHQMIRQTARSFSPESMPPGGSMPDELVRFVYPLHKGQHWIVRTDPLFELTVEGHEMIQVPAGKSVGIRMRMESELFGPNDEVLFWYSRDGQLKLYASIEASMADDSGNPLGTVSTEEIEVLERATLR